uniref:Uncharacterized protein n=1 Tax=Anguilla anguilla TaxID=7936 RepID=A0A0E9WWU2_ANGAN
MHSTTASCKYAVSPILSQKTLAFIHHKCWSSHKVHVRSIKKCTVS